MVGCGTIGAGWSALAVRQGFQVRVFDPRPGADARIARAQQCLNDACGTTETDGTLEMCSTLSDAVSRCDFVQESGPEMLHAKKRLFKEICRLAPLDAIVATSSSGLAISDIQGDCIGPERCLIGHPFNPPYLIPLVEVVAGAMTLDKFVDRAIELYRRLGKLPVRLSSEIQGYVANRLQNALFREAVYLVESGAATVEEIDQAIARGPGLRWALMGPFQTFALGGGDGGMEDYFEKFDDELRLAWRDLGSPRLTEAAKRTIIEGVERIQAGKTLDDWIADRDRRLARILKAVIDVDA